MQVLDFELQRQLVPYMKQMVPLPGIYDADFIAANQDARADNIIKGNKKDQAHPLPGPHLNLKEVERMPAWESVCPCRGFKSNCAFSCVQVV